jgi:hypothetical protein
MGLAGASLQDQYAYITRYLPGGYAYRGETQQIRGTRTRLVSPLEFSLTAGIASAPGSSRDPAAALGLAAGLPWIRATATGSWVRLRKDATPGGYAVGGNAGAEAVLGRVLVGGGITRTFADQEIWTKRVHYLYGTTAYRWKLNEVRATYFRETFSTYANRTEEYRLGYTLDSRLGTGPWCVRLYSAIGAMYFDDNPYPGAQRRRGLTGKFGVGLSYRP